MPKTIWKGGALIAPLPAVLVTSSAILEDGRRLDNIFTAAWTGIINTVPPKTYVSIRKSRFSYNLINISREFVINIPNKAMAREVDFCGIYTGKKVDKFEKCNFTKEQSQLVSAPSIAQCPICLECKVSDIISLGSHDMFIADIVSSSIESSLIDASGKLELDKAGLMAFAHGEYFELGKKIGYFGFSAKKKHKKNNRSVYSYNRKNTKSKHNKEDKK